MIIRIVLRKGGIIIHESKDVKVHAATLIRAIEQRPIKITVLADA